MTILWFASQKYMVALKNIQQVFKIFQEKGTATRPRRLDDQDTFETTHKNL